MAGASATAGGSTRNASAGGSLAADTVKTQAAQNPKIRIDLIVFSWPVNQECLVKQVREVSQRYSTLPGNEIVLSQGFGPGSDLATGHLDDGFEYGLSHLFNRLLAGNDRAGVNVNNVPHPSRKIGIGRDLDSRRRRLARWRAETGRE